MIEKQLTVTITKADDNDDGQWIMAAASPDLVNDTIEPSAFVDAIKKISGKLIALWQHDRHQPIGYWHDLKYKAGQLIGSLKLSDTNLGKMIKQLLSDDVPLGASIGFRGEGDYNDLGGINFTAIELFETSIVSVPAQPKAQRILKSFGVTIPLSEDSTSPVTSDDLTVKTAKAAILAANKLLRRKDE